MVNTQNTDETKRQEDLEKQERPSVLGEAEVRPLSKAVWQVLQNETYNL